MPTLADKAARLGIPVAGRSSKKAPQKAATELKEGKAAKNKRIVINLKASSFSSSSSAPEYKVKHQGTCCLLYSLLLSVQTLINLSIQATQTRLA